MKERQIIRATKRTVSTRNTEFVRTSIPCEYNPNLFEVLIHHRTKRKFRVFVSVRSNHALSRNTEIGTIFIFLAREWNPLAFQPSRYRNRGNC